MKWMVAQLIEAEEQGKHKKKTNKIDLYVNVLYKQNWIFDRAK